MERHTLQQRPALQTPVDAVTHPSFCTGNAYSQDTRHLVMFIHNHMLDEEDGATREFVAVLRHQHVYPSSITVSRWERLLEGQGHLRPCRRSGNVQAYRMTGIDLVYLSLFRVAYPKATIAEINAFLYRCNLGNPFFTFYSQSQISKSESLIGLSRKVGSTTAYQAYYPVNLQKRWEYWNYAFPLGIADIRRSNIIDLDECGINMEVSANRKYGKAYTGIRVKEEGPYVKGEKWNLLLAISGERVEDGGNQDARRWATMWLNGGTTIDKFLRFVQDILDSIGEATDDNFYVFTMDNLNTHKNAAIIALIHLYGHGVVYRAPYWAVDGPIEFVFNTIQTLTRARLYDIMTSQDLVISIQQAIQSIDTFEHYFVHCGFVRD